MTLPAPNRQPTPQGTYDLSPQGTLSRLARLANCKPADLATLTIDIDRYAYYHPILDYLAMCHPLSSNIASKWHPLTLSDNQDMQYDDDTSQASAEEEHPAIIYLARFCYGLGETSFVWPPPPHLSAESLSADRREKMKLNNGNVVRNEGHAATPPQPSVEKAADDSGDHEVQHHSASYSAPGDENLNIVQRSTIYIAHYNIEKHNSATHNEILLASPEGPDTLRSFVNEIRKWDKDQHIPRKQGQREFTLQRFRKEEGNGGYWEDEGLRKARSIQSVVLADNCMEQIVQDVQAFLDPSCTTWYAEHGIPLRRSYMFYGPPGTGKTSTICAIASKFRLNCCFLSMTTCHFSNQDLCDALSNIPPHAMLVLEDVDTLFNEDRKHEEGSSLTFSGMLNALDGVVSADGLITVMTTNHFDRLDQSLVRGGRVDRRFHFGSPTQNMIQILFTRFYPGEHRIAQRFAEQVFAREEGQEIRSIATLQQLFIQCRGKSAQICLQTLPAFAKSHFPDLLRLE